MRLTDSHEFNETRANTSETVYIPIEGLGEARGVEYTLRLLDEYGNQLLAFGDLEVPMVVGESGVAASESAPRRSRAWIWALVGVLVAGAATGTILGVVFTREDQTVTEVIEHDTISIGTSVTTGLE